MPKVIADTSTVLVLNKPAGLIVHSDGRTVEPSVAEWIAENYPTLAGVGKPWVSPQGERVRVCGLVHRLDRTTSGVLVAAKNQDVFTYLKGEFKARRVEKTYHALVYGHVDGESGRIVAEIARTGTAPKRWYAKPREASHPRAAITEWRVLKRLKGDDPVTYLELSPKTGRTHQLRVHLASIGHPIVGDHLYAHEKLTLSGFTRPALHAYSISFSVDGERRAFIAQLPADFERAL